MKLTQELIDQIQEAMLHTKKDGTVNWKDPVVSAAPHPDFDYEKKVFTKDGREEYMKELKKDENTKLATSLKKGEEKTP